MGLIVGAALLISAFPVFNGASLLGALIVYGILMSIHARRALKRTPYQEHTAADVQASVTDYGAIEEEAVRLDRSKSLLRGA